MDYSSLNLNEDKIKSCLEKFSSIILVTSIGGPIQFDYLDVARCFNSIKDFISNTENYVNYAFIFSSGKDWNLEQNIVSYGNPDGGEDEEAVHTFIVEFLSIIKYND